VTTAATQPRSARSLLVEWANDQDPWIRGLIGEILRSRRAITPERVDHFYERLLVEKGLVPGTPEPAPPLELAADVDDLEERLVLVKLDAVQNVNALTADQSIGFNEGLTVAFGRNGAGKSGYVRIFKRLAAVRGAEPVLPNVHSSAVNLPTPRARVAFRVGTVDHVVEWTGEEGGVHPLTRMDVFDARANTLHVDEDLTFVYTPSDLALFRHAHEGVEAVRAKLEAGARASAPATNPFVSRFARDTPLYAAIETLGAATDLAELERQAVVTPEEAASLDGHRERVAALRPGGADARVQQADSERRLLEQGMAVCGMLANFDRAAYDRARAAAELAESRYVAATESAFSGADVPGVLGEAWREFVSAADAYRKVTGGESYPSAGDKCLYCRQSLTEAAVSLLARYRDYCNNQLRKDRDATREALNRSVGSLAMDLRPLEAEIARRRELATGGALPAPLARLADALAAATAMQVSVRSGMDVASVAAEEIAALRETLTKRIEEAMSLIDTLRGQADDRRRAFATESAALRDLEARMALRDVMADVRAYVERARWASKAQALVPRFRGPLKSLTVAAKEASEGLVSQDFERAFRAECQALRAPDVRLDFPGRKGQAARRKAIAAHKLSEVLSEGEQKVIALADFLAEAQLKSAPSPIVFDDPVTSLDYERMREVVDRIVKLSARRQVVVFTHNVWFAIELLNRFEKDKDRCSYYDIAENAGACGFVTGGSHPRVDTVRLIKGKINDVLQQARKLTGEAQAALIERGYEHIRAWCEVAVESELLLEVIERYKPHVKMTALPKIKPQALGPAVGTIVPIFEKACRYIGGHSQPLETLNVRPSLAELEADWSALQAALKTYQDAKP